MHFDLTVLHNTIIIITINIFTKVNEKTFTSTLS